MRFSTLSLRDSCVSSDRFPVLQPLDFGGTRGVRLVEGKRFNLNTRKRAAFLTARINTYAAVVNVDAPASVATFPRKKSSRSVAKETQFAIIALEEIQVASPNQHLRISF